MDLDEIDWKIITQLQQDGRTGYKELGETIGFTGLGAKKRVEKLLERDAIRISTLLNVEKLGFYLGLILLEMENAEAQRKILNRFEECPRVINIFRTQGGYNLVALVMAEDRGTFESESIESCSLRSSEGIRRSEFYPISKTYYSPFLLIREQLSHKERTAAPCGADCRNCQSYKTQECLACPTLECYRGVRHL